MYKYFRLLDKVHKNTVVRANGRDQQQFIKEKGWVQSGIMIDYFSDESNTYDLYEEISEKTALSLIGEKNALF